MIALPRDAAIAGICDLETRCGCPSPTCVDDLSASGLVTSALRCLTGIECAEVCGDNAGQPGTKAHTQCLAPKAIERGRSDYRAESVGLYCARATKCGCGSADCVPKVTALLGQSDGDLLDCVSRLPCAGACEPQAGDPGTMAHAACFAPLAAAARARNRVDLNELKRMDAQHRLNMSIIRGMSSGNTRVLDANGNLLYRE